MGTICREFNCTPAEALKQNPQMVFSILRHRQLSYTHAHRDDVSQLTPEQVDAWKEMMNA